MRIASWGPLAQDVLYILASTVNNQRLIEWSAKYNRNERKSYIYINAVGSVGKRPDIIVFRFNGTVEFPDVRGAGPKNDEILKKFQGQILKGVSVEHTEGPAGIGGKPVSVETTTSNPDFWDRILTITVLDRIQNKLSLDRKTIGGTKHVEPSGTEPVEPIEFDYEIAIPENIGVNEQGNDYSRIVIQYGIKGHTTKDRIHKTYAPVAPSQPRPTVPDLLKANEVDKEGYLIRPFTMRAPNAGPAFDIAPEGKKPRNIQNRTTRNPMLEYFYLDVPDAYVEISAENLPKTKSMVYTLFKPVPAIHEGSSTNTPLVLPQAFWLAYFKSNSILADHIFNAINKAWGKRVKTDAEKAEDVARAQLRSDKVLQDIIEANPTDPNDLDRARLKRWTALPKTTDPTRAVVPLVDKLMSDH